jgi:DNA repair ATPase RecN
MRDAGLVRAVERVTLACSALTAAAGDLAVARRHGEKPSAGTVEELNLEVERVCELARELGHSAATLDTLAGARE